MEARPRPSDGAACPSHGLLGRATEGDAAKTKTDSKTDTRTARAKLSARPEPYVLPIGKGCALGYFKGLEGGTWVARFRDGEGKLVGQGEICGALCAA